MDYLTIINCLNELKKDIKYKYYSSNRLIDIAIKQKPKKSSLEMLVKNYCDKNNIDYSTILKKVEYVKNMNKYEGYSDFEILSIALTTNVTTRRKLRTGNNIQAIYYKGIPLKEYCNLNGLPYHLIYNRIHYFINKNDRKINDEFIDEVIKHKYIARYYYNESSLREYCEQNNLNYKAKLSRIHYLKTIKFNGVNIDEIIDKAINMESMKHRYFYQDMPLKKYCDDNQISYDNISKNVRSILSDSNNKLAQEVVIDKVIKQVNRKKRKLKVLELLNNNQFNDDELVEICDYLNIDRHKVSKLEKLMPIKTSIYLNYYFQDKKNEENKGFISFYKIKEVEKLVDKIKKSSLDNSKEFELGDLIGVYKCGYYDTRWMIINNLEEFFTKNTKYCCHKYNAPYSLYQDAISAVKLELINSLDYIVPPEIDPKIYFNKVVAGTVARIVKKHKNESNELTLNAPKYEEYDENIDYIASPTTGFENLFKNVTFSKDVAKALSKLTLQERKFIILRFKEEYSYKELASLYKVDEEKVIKKEKSILGKLENDFLIKNKVAREKNNH